MRRPRPRRSRRAPPHSPAGYRARTSADPRVRPPHVLTQTTTRVLEPSDLDAALAVDCQPVLVKTGKGERTLAKALPASTLVFDDLAAVAAHLLQ